MEKVNIEFLNSIRGLAAASVLCTHGITEEYFFHGSAFGVNEFFLMSSFLLTFHYLKRMESTTGTLGDHFNQLINYLVMRFFRIYVPFAIFCILAKLVSYEMFLNKHGPQIPLENFLLLNFEAMEYHTYLWTIPIEIKYYLLIPAFALIAGRLKLSYKWNCLLHLILLITICCIVYFGVSFYYNYKFLIYLPVFLIGSSLAVLYKSLLDEEIILKICEYKKICHFICISSFLMFYGGIKIQVILKGHYLQSIYWSIHMLLMLIGAPNLFTEFLIKIKLLQWIGKYSYGFYLFHVFVISLYSLQYKSFAWFRIFDGLIFKILVLFGQTLFFGFVYFELIENNCIKIAKRINDFLSKYFK